MILSRLLSFVAAFILAAAPAAPQRASDGNWPSFRGLYARGIADGHPTAATWDLDTSANVRWKTPLAGLGHSSPIVWGNLVCVTTAISGRKDATLKPGLYGNIQPVLDDTEHVWKVICLDKRTGKPAWEQTPRKSVPIVKRHTKSTHANATLATDGRRIVALLGSEGMYAYDMKGKLLWTKDLGVLDAGYFMVPDAQWEFSSSPVIHDGVVIVQADVQKGSFIAAFDAASGREIWRTPRGDVPTFGTPTVHVDRGRTQLLVNGWRHIGAYDFKTGAEVWRMKGGGDIPVPTPVVANGLVYITNAHGRQGAPIYAIKTTASGDISLAEGETSNQHIAWSQNREGAYMITPLVYGDYLYNCTWQGVLSAYEAATGTRMYQQRLGAGTTAFTASPVAADGKIYYASEEGDVFVVKAGPTFELVATNHLNEVTMASPAISDGVLYFRTQGHLIAIGTN
jgi:outer membrane protein assembly factor BamB